MMNSITIHTKYCKQCGICIAFCPAKVFGAKPDGSPEVLHPEVCTGCGMCQRRCPDFAIEVEVKK